MTPRGFCRNSADRDLDFLGRCLVIMGLPPESLGIPSLCHGSRKCDFYVFLRPKTTYQGTGPNGTAVLFEYFSGRRAAGARTFNAAGVRASQNAPPSPNSGRPTPADLGTRTFLGVNSRPMRPSLGLGPLIRPRKVSCHFTNIPI